MNHLEKSREINSARYNVKESNSLIRNIKKQIRKIEGEILKEAKSYANLGQNLIALEKELSSAEYQLRKEKRILEEIENEK